MEDYLGKEVRLGRVVAITAVSIDDAARMALKKGLGALLAKLDVESV